MTTNININENFQQANLPQSIIWPENPDDVPWFMMRLYEQLVFAINNKDSVYFKMAIGTSAVPIQNIAETGSYIVCISGSDVYKDATGLNYWKTEVFAVTKTQPNVNGTSASLSSQAGSGVTLAASAYTLSYGTISTNSTNTYLKINHNIAGVTGSFNVRVIGTK